MTYYLIISLCVIILISYLFELSSRVTKVPGVLLLIITGMVINFSLKSFQITIPDLSSLLPMMGTLGLILIVLEGSLDLTINKEKKGLIISSITSAILLFVLFEVIFTAILVNFYSIPVRTALLNTIPFGVISSAVAIPSASILGLRNREFVTYESSFSDIFGILAFDFILLNYSSFGASIFRFTSDLVLTILASVILSVGLAYILHKINHHVKYVVITTVVILIYSLAKIIHMPSLLVVLIFGLVMNNNHFFKNIYSVRHIDFDGFNNELTAFKRITAEMTFVVRSFFFIMVGYYTSITDLLSPENLLLAVIISSSIFILRALFLKFVLKSPLNPLLYFAPRGLITILLFLSIPADISLPFLNNGVITQVIFITILFMTFGNIIFRKQPN